MSAEPALQGAGPASGGAVSAPRQARRLAAPRAVLAVAVLGTFMAFVDATIVNIAIPNIAHDFSGSRLTTVSWVLNAYNIVFAAFLVGGGQLADLLGRRRVFSFSLILFTLASALCAAAPSLNLLVAARVIQAAGSAMLVPSSLAIVLQAHEARERQHAVALWSAVAALAAGIGPPLGGLLITASNWRLVFLVNIPVGIVAVVLAQRVLIESRAPGRRRVPDLLGGVVLALAIASLVLGVVKGEEWGWSNGRVVAAFAVALLLGVYFVLRSSRHRTPVIDLSLMRIRAFALSNGVTIVMASGFYAYTLCNVLFLTEVWRYSILTAGLALTPGPFTAMAVAGPASRLVERFGHRAVVVPGALIWAGGMLFFVETIGLHPDFLGRWLPGLVILGIGAGLSFPTLSGAAVGSVPGPRFGVATALNSVSRQIGAALGVAILIAIIGTPSPLEVLHAFQHGWLFAGGCFVFGAIACVALTVTPAAEGGATVEALRNGSRAPAPAAAPATDSLPNLRDSAGELADVEPQTVADFLLNVEVFAGLPAELREEVAALADDVTLHREEWLFREGDDADAVYIVRVGHLEVLQGEPEPQPINTLTRGAVLGELALLSDSTRSASVRALRDTELVRIGKPSFDSLLRSRPELALGLTRVLSAQLQASRAIPVAKRPCPVTIAMRGVGPGSGVLDLADDLSRALCAWGRVAVVHPGPDHAEPAGETRAEATARYAPLIERCEESHDQVILVCGDAAGGESWESFCLARADRVLVVLDARDEGGEHGEHALVSSAANGAGGALAALRGCDLVGLGVRRGSGMLDAAIEQISPPSVFAVADSTRTEDVERMARRLSGRALGVVLAGGGARAFAHLGALEVLLDAGMVADRVAGVSMGSFIGGLLASGLASAEMDACCYEEWVRRNPINDYTFPRAGLIKGHKAEAMLERVFGETRIEELSRPYYCACVNIRGGHLEIDRRGPLVLAIGSSMTLPLIAPPIRREDRLLIDGSLLDNLPLPPMTSTGEGPVLAIDIKGEGGHTAELPAHVPVELVTAGVRPHRERMPPLPQTMARVALLSSANTDESARRHADMTIRVRVPGVGLLEFHQIDQAREEGRRAAREALEGNLPEWLLDGHPAPQSLAGRRTVVRV